MPRQRSTRPLLPRAPWRALAGLLAVLIVGLGLANASPEAHAWMHGAEAHAHEACAHTPTAVPEPQHDDHVCAVVLFAHGAELCLYTSFVVRPSEELGAFVLTPDALFLAKPRYLRQPERGPPLA